MGSPDQTHELPERAAQEPARLPAGFGDDAPVPSQDQDRAEPPQPPLLPARLRAVERERGKSLRVRETLERRSILRGLILLALIVLVISLIRAGADRAFPAGWWRRW